MGFQNDKEELFKQVGVFKTITGLPKPKKTNSLDSVNSKSKNILPFLLDLLSSSCLDNSKTPKDKARCESSKILIEILTEFLPRLIKIIKEGIIKGIKAGLMCGTDFTIPVNTPTLTTEINKIDLNDMMKLDPNGPAGLLFGDPTKDFNRFLLNTITSKGSNTWVDKKGSPLMDVTYNDVPNPTVTIKISDNRAGTSFHDFLIDYVNSVELFNLNNVMGTIMEQKTGLISSVNNIGVDTLLNMIKMDSCVDKLLEVDVCGDNAVIDDSFFNFTQEELEFFEREAYNKSRGVNVLDLGCGLVDVVIPTTVFDDIKQLDSVTTPTAKKQVIESVIETTSESVSSSSEGGNKLTIKNNFKKDVVLSFPKTLMRMVVTPKIITLYQVSHNTVNSGVLQVNNGYEFSNSARTFFDYVTREASAALIEIVFNKIKRELISLITRVVSKIIKEKMQLYIGSIAGIYLSKAISDPNKVLDGLKNISNSIDSFNQNTGNLL